MDFLFVLNSILLGIGLAMDAFSVSLANGLNSPCMKPKRMMLIAGTFAFFQALMPLTGWYFVHTFIKYFNRFQKFIPIIALLLLVFIGIKMLKDAKCEQEECDGNLTLGILLIQGIATSIDALSVGFTIAHLTFYLAVLSALIIELVTFVICLLGVFLGKEFGTKFSGKAQMLGGIILIGIGIEIFINGMFF